MRRGLYCCPPPQFQELPADPLSEKLRESQRDAPVQTTRSLSPPIPTVGRRRRTLPHSLRHSHRQGDLLLRAGPSGEPDASRRPDQSQEGRQSPQRTPGLRHGSPSSLASFGSGGSVDSGRLAELARLRQEKGAKAGQSPARGAVTAPSFPGSEGRRLGGPENFGALGGRPAAALRLAPRPPLGP